MRRFFRQFRRLLPGVRAFFSHRNFILGLPAFLIAGGLVFVCVAAERGARSNAQLRHYEQIASTADENEKPEVAELYLRKLISRVPQKPEYKFLLAKTVSQLGDNERSVRLLQGLAPEDSYGYGPAHLGIAMGLARSQNITHAQLARIEHHAKMVLEHDPRNVDAHGLLGLVYVRYEDNQKAIQHLKIAAEKLQRYRMILAYRYSQEGETELGMRFANAAANGYRRALEKDSTNVDARLGFARSQLFLENYDAVERVLKENESAIQDERVKSLLVEIYLALWDVLDRKGDRDIARRVRIMHEVMQVAPDNPKLLKKVAVLVASHSNGSQLKEARSILRRAITNGKATASLHLILGMAALRAGNSKQAGLHLDLARRLEPNSQQTLAGLALSYARMKPPRVNDALRLMNSIHADAFHDDPILLGIRGEVYAAAKDDRRALPDLERALELSPAAVDVRETLSKVYDRLGEEEIAKFHREVVAKKPAVPDYTPVITDAEARMIARAKLGSSKSRNTTRNNGPPVPTVQKQNPQRPIPTQVAKSTTQPGSATTKSRDRTAAKIQPRTIASVTDIRELPIVYETARFQRTFRGRRKKIRHPGN